MFADMKIPKIFKMIEMFVLFFLMFIFFSGCVKYQGDVNDPSISNVVANDTSIPIADNSKIISYCAKEKSAENRIFFDYPQFKETVLNADKMNKLIVELVEDALQRDDEAAFKGNLKDSPENWKWNEDEYTLLAMDISYKITRNDSDYFSVIFEGDFNHKFAAHPLNYFNSLIIDVGKCEVVILPDLYHINEEFVNLFREKFKEQIRSVLAEKMGGVLRDEDAELVENYLSDRDDDFLLEVLRNPGYRSFLTDTALGISVFLGRAFGNHAEITISYDDLIEYLLIEE